MLLTDEGGRSARYGLELSYDSLLKGAYGTVSRQKVLSHLLMLPGVEEAEVIGEKQANGDDRLIAFLSGQVPAPDARLMSLLAGKLRAWEIPHRILRVASIPKTSTGKTDRKRLLAMAEAVSLG